MGFRKLLRLGPQGPRLVTLACVVPDVDGLGIIPEIFTRNSAHPLLWFSLYHHSLHNLAFALVIAAIAFALAAQKWKTGLLALLSFPYICLKTCWARAGLRVISGFRISRRSHRCNLSGEASGD